MTSSGDILLRFAAEVGQAWENSGITQEYQQSQHDLKSHSSPSLRGVLQMWSLLPLLVGLETTDNSVLSYWISPKE